MSEKRKVDADAKPFFEGSRSGFPARVLCNVAVTMCLLIMASGIGKVRAAEILKLRTLTFTGAPIAKNLLTSVTLPAIDKELAVGGKYKIEWDNAESTDPAEIFASMQAGSADIALFSTEGSSDKFVFQQITYAVPFNGADPARLLRAFRMTIDQVPEMRQAFFGVNQILLSVAAADELVLVSNKPVAAFADLKGRTVGVSALTGNWLPGAGVKAIFGPVSDHVLALGAGKLDAAILPIGDWIAAKSRPPTFFVTDVGFGAMMQLAVTAGKSRWDGLPPEVSGAILNAFGAFEERLAILQTEDAIAKRKALAQAGLTFRTLAQSEQVKWANLLPNLALEWAQGANRAGWPGAQAIASYVASLTASGAVPLRNRK